MDITPGDGADRLERLTGLEAQMPDVDVWRATWEGLGAGACDDRLYWEIVEQYTDPGRRYHTMQHLDECFARFGEVRTLAEHPHEIELALWFHDAVYDVRKQDNEERSAAWARDVAVSSGLAPAVADRVHALVMATKHDAMPETADGKLMVDVDLSILAAPAERFDEYERQVRDEYSWVPGFLFRRKRREILEAFLSRPHLFNTEHFRGRYESLGRANLERSIAALGG